MPSDHAHESKRVFLSSAHIGNRRLRDLVHSYLDNRLGVKVWRSELNMSGCKPSEEQIFRKLESAVKDSDVVVVLLANRYGTLTSRTGFTEFEYLTARAFNIPTLVYRLNYTLPEIDKRQEKLQAAFVCMIDCCSVVASQSDLLSEILRDVRALLLGKRVFQPAVHSPVHHFGRVHNGLMTLSSEGNGDSPKGSWYLLQARSALDSDHRLAMSLSGLALQEFLQVADKHQDRRTLRMVEEALAIRAVASSWLGLPSLSLVCTQQRIHLKRQLNEERSIYGVAGQLASKYYELGCFETALKYAQAGSTRGLTANSTMSAILSRLGRHRESMRERIAAVDESVRTDNVSAIALNTAFLGLLEITSGVRAVGCRKLEEACQIIGLRGGNRARLLRVVAEAHRHLGDLAASRDLLMEARMLAGQDGAIGQFRKISRELAVHPSSDIQPMPRAS